MKIKAQKLKIKYYKTKFEGKEISGSTGKWKMRCKEKLEN